MTAYTKLYLLKYLVLQTYENIDNSVERDANYANY